MTKGLEAELPDGHSFDDKDGHRRSMVRVKWWKAEEATYRNATWGDQDFCDKLPKHTVPASACIGYANDKPLFFGHYWQSGHKDLLTSRIACVDYSTGRDGPLVAYRWAGKRDLDAKKFISSDFPDERHAALACQP